MPQRVIIISALSFLLIALLYYGAHFHPWIETSDCLEHPDEYDGKLVTLYSEPMIGDIYSDGFQLLQKHMPPIRVYSDTTGLRTGEFIGLRATFHREGYLKAVSFRVARNRRYKIWLSVVPVVFIGIALLHFFRINWKPFQIELRTHARSHHPCRSESPGLPTI